MKTYSAKAADIEKKWVTIDATGLVVGRLASIVALRLRGKHKPSYTPHVDDGDNVIIVNAAKAVLTGRKREKKVYHHHTGFIGGIKDRTAKAILEGRFPERIVEKNMHAIPDHVSYQDAALVEPLACVMRGLEESGVKPGDTVAVIGLGPIGMMFVRLAKSVYNARVIAIGRRRSQLDRASGMGARKIRRKNHRARK